VSVADASAGRYDQEEARSLVGRAVLYSSVFGSGGWRVGAARGPAVRWVCPHGEQTLGQRPGVDEPVGRRSWHVPPLLATGDPPGDTPGLEIGSLSRARADRP